MATPPAAQPPFPWQPLRSQGAPQRPEVRHGSAGTTGEVEAEAAAAVAVSFCAVTPGRHHGGLGFTGAAGLGAHRALAAAHVREGAGAGKGGNGGVERGYRAQYRPREGYSLPVPCCRWATSRCRPPWGGTSLAARYTSCPASSLTVSPPWWGRPGAVLVPPWGPPGADGPRCPQPSTS